MLSNQGARRRTWFSNKVVTGFRSNDTVALTFDDGPDSQFTPRVLEILKRHGARATFFTIGRQAELYPYILRQIEDAGCEVANHSYSHPSFSLLSVFKRVAELLHCERAIGKSGQMYFRPPFGHASNNTPFWASLLNYTTVCWSVDVKDWEIKDPDTILDLLTMNVRPGAIVLLHDRVETATDASFYDREAMLTALDKFLDKHKSSIKFKMLSEVFSACEVILADWDKSLSKDQRRLRQREFLALKRNAP